MASQQVHSGRMSIRLACDTFVISQTCYRYTAKLSTDNALIADWLVRLTQNQRNWGFGLCFLYLRNVNCRKEDNLDQNDSLFHEFTHDIAQKTLLL
jgi:hypothetical protein